MADIEITPTLTPSSIASPTPNGATTTINVSVLYTDGSTSGGANPISNRYIALSADNGVVTAITDPASYTNEFGWVYGGVLTVGCIDTDTTVVITAADDGGFAPSPITALPYSGTAELTIKADPAGCP